jgi:hypothetical protein
VEVLIPSILHLENRVTEKRLTMILRYGLEKYAGSKMEFVVIQTQVLGTIMSLSNWKLRYTKNGNEPIIIENIQVRNQTGRAMLKNVDHMIETTISNDRKKNQLVLAVAKYTQGMSVLTIHQKLLLEEKEMFQDLMDEFFQLWVELFADEGITNYIHMLGSGHLLYFLERYDCLYMYWQQGWEALNNTVTAFIHQNSSRRGKNSGENGDKTLIFLLVRYILHDLLWKTGEADKFFRDLENNPQL